MIEDAALLLSPSDRAGLADSLRLSLERPVPSLEVLERRIEETFVSAFSEPFEDWGDEQWAALRRGERSSPSGSGEGAPPGWFASRLAKRAG